MFLAHNFIHRSPQNDLHKSRGLFFILFARLLHLILITCLLLTKNIYLFIDIKSIRRHYYFSCDLHMSRTTQHNPESIKQEEKSFFLFKTYSYMKWNEINIQSRQIFKYITHTRMYNVSYVKKESWSIFLYSPRLRINHSSSQPDQRPNRDECWTGLNNFRFSCFYFNFCVNWRKIRDTFLDDNNLYIEWKISKSCRFFKFCPIYICICNVHMCM